MKGAERLLEDLKTYERVVAPSAPKDHLEYVRRLIEQGERKPTRAWANEVVVLIS